MSPREAAMAFVQRNGPLMAASIDVITGKLPESSLPLGVLEAERERAGIAGASEATSASVENGSASEPLPSPVLVPDFGTEGATLQPVALGVAVDPLAAAPSSEPVRCAECGTELVDHEIARIEQAKGSKFEQLCSDCTRLALGLL